MNIIYRLAIFKSTPKNNGDVFHKVFYKLSHGTPITVYHDARPWLANPRISHGRKDKDARARPDIDSTRILRPQTEGRSMKDACGCLVLQSFNTTRGVRAGRQHEKRKQETECTGKSIGRKRETDAEQKTERERKPEKGNISDDWYCRRCARDAECRGVESAVFKWGGH